MKTKESELLQQINSLQESCSKHEITAQTYSLKNTKLEMRLKALETEMEGVSGKLSSAEKENTKLTSEVTELSDKVKNVTMETLDTEQNIRKSQQENESEWIFWYS